MKWYGWCLLLQMCACVIKVCQFNLEGIWGRYLIDISNNWEVSNTYKKCTLSVVRCNGPGIKGNGHQIIGSWARHQQYAQGRSETTFISSGAANTTSWNVCAVSDLLGGASFVSLAGQHTFCWQNCDNQAVICKHKCLYLSHRSHIGWI